MSFEEALAERVKLDRSLVRHESWWLNPPEARASARRVFANRSIDLQWCVIREWMQRNNHGPELFAESVQFHKNCAAIMHARFSGDHDTAARLIEEAQREYLGSLIQKEWDQNE